MKPSTKQALALLRARPDGVTSLDALYAGCGSRMASRVAELKEAGFDISTELVSTDKGARVARYRLREQPTQLALGIAS
ncbi:MAG: helix-turn-helix domain-containing protein [Gaiellales bacterium]